MSLYSEVCDGRLKDLNEVSKKQSMYSERSEAAPTRQRQAKNNPATYSDLTIFFNSFVDAQFFAFPIDPFMIYC